MVAGFWELGMGYRVFGYWTGGNGYMGTGQRVWVPGMWVQSSGFRLGTVYKISGYRVAGFSVLEMSPTVPQKSAQPRQPQALPHADEELAAEQPESSFAHPTLASSHSHIHSVIHSSSIHFVVTNK